MSENKKIQQVFQSVSVPFLQKLQKHMRIMISRLLGIHHLMTGT